MRPTLTSLPKQIAQPTEPPQADDPDPAELAVLPDCVGDVVVDRDGEFRFWARASAKTKREVRTRVKRTGFDRLVTWVDYRRARDECCTHANKSAGTHQQQDLAPAERLHRPQTYEQKPLF